MGGATNSSTAPALGLVEAAGPMTKGRPVARQLARPLSSEEEGHAQVSGLARAPGTFMAERMLD